MDNNIKKLIVGRFSYNQGNINMGEVGLGVEGRGYRMMLSQGGHSNKDIYNGYKDGEVYNGSGEWG